MRCKVITIVNKLGLHARAAAKFVSLASNYASDITLSKDNLNVNGKSIMGIMMLAAAQGVELNLCADGEDEDEAIDALTKLIRDYFGEED